MPDVVESENKPLTEEMDSTSSKKRRLTDDEEEEEEEERENGDGEDSKVEKMQEEDNDNDDLSKQRRKKKSRWGSEQDEEESPEKPTTSTKRASDDDDNVDNTSTTSSSRHRDRDYHRSSKHDDDRYYSSRRSERYATNKKISQSYCSDCCRSPEKEIPLPEEEIVQFNPDDVVLDFCKEKTVFCFTLILIDLFLDTSDLTLTFATDCYSASTKSNDALCFLWAGTRATYGFKQGKICYEIRVRFAFSEMIVFI